MSKNQLHRIIFEIFLLDFTDDPLKVNDHDHLALMTLPSAEVHPPALELKYSLRFWLHERWVVNQVWESFGAIFHYRSTILVSLKIIAGCSVIILLLLLMTRRWGDLLLLLLQLALAKLDKFALECFTNLHLCEGLLDRRPQMYALYIAVIGKGLGEGRGPSWCAFWSIWCAKVLLIATICTKSTFTALQITPIMYHYVLLGVVASLVWTGAGELVQLVDAVYHIQMESSCRNFIALLLM